jgi:L-fuconolactonase
MLNVNASKFNHAQSGPVQRRVDAHHHLWRYRSEELDWIDDSMAELRRDFLVADLESVMHSSNIDVAITVQARASTEETTWLLDCADGQEKIAGVVGWASLRSDDLPASLDQFASRGKLLGLREIVQAEVDGYLDQPSLDRGIAELTRRDLTYDLLIRDNQLEEAMRFVDRHPRQRFVLDHAAKPRIAKSEIEPWRGNILNLAKRENVLCKLSGLTTEASWSEWTLESLRPYLDICVDAFGPKRLMVGSDWPVCLVATTYSRWWDTLSEYLACFSDSDRESILGSTALLFYRPALVSSPEKEAES